MTKAAFAGVADRSVAQAGANTQAAARTPTMPAMPAKLIRTAQLEVQVGSVVRTMLAADSIARQRDALVTDSRSNESPDGPRDAQFVVRVPSARFAETLMALRGLGDVRNEVTGTQDVTREYADLETRVTVKRETVARLRGLLADRTGKLSDVLEVERELARAVTELEQMEGEQRYYDAQLAVSSITVHVFEKPPAIRATLTAPLSDALRHSAEVFSTSVAALVYLVTFLAPWAVLAGAGWWIVRKHPIWTRRA
jgi:hypothetical protein